MADEGEGAPATDKKSKKIKFEDEAEGQGKKDETKYEEDSKYKPPKCNLRIEELAKPNRMHMKLTYKNYKYVLPERNVKAVLFFLREEFAKPPEEIEEQFKELSHKVKEKKCRRICKKEARISHYASLRARRRKFMLKILTDLLKRYITRAYFHPKQIIMTTRLRRVSNIILRHLCKIRGISVPKREQTNIRAQLMFATADFFAYCVDTIYYELQVQKVADYEKLKEMKDLLFKCTPYARCDTREKCKCY